MNVKIVVRLAGHRANELRNDRKRRRSEARLRGTEAASEPRSPGVQSGSSGGGESSEDEARNAVSPRAANMSHAVCHATPPASVLVVAPTRGGAMGWKSSSDLQLYTCSAPHEDNTDADHHHLEYFYCDMIMVTRR